MMRARRGVAAAYLRDIVLAYDGYCCLIWPYARDDKGYAQISVGRKTRKVSRVVCAEFRGAPTTSKHDAAHLCGQGHTGCVTKRHLDWKTRKANIADKAAHGTMPRGGSNPNVKLTEGNVRDIRALRGVRTLEEIAKVFGVTNQTISGIFTGRTWAWLE